MPSIVQSPQLRTTLATKEEVAALHTTAGGIGMCPYHNALKAGDAKGLQDVAAQMMRDHNFGDQSFPLAEKVLREALQQDPADKDGKTNQLMGMALFHQQKWGDAVKHLQVAVARDPQNKDAAGLLEKAKTNAGTGIEKAFGTMKPLDGMELLKPPALFIRAPEDVRPLPAAQKQGWLTTMFRAITGKMGGAVAEAGIKVAGKARDKDTTFAYESWDKQSDLVGKLMLADIRHDLNADKLQSTYDPGVLVGFQQPGQKRPEWTERFRTATGAWTTDNPMEGAAGTEFQRTGAPANVRVNRALDPSLPNPREVSRVFLHPKGERKTVPFLNPTTIWMLQANVHDWINHPPSMSDGAFKIPLAQDDPARSKYGVDAMFVPKTAANPLAQAGKITHLSEVSHWWDASEIYGSDQGTQDRLRKGGDGKFLADGKLRIEGDLLPLNPETGIEDTGFARNWSVGLNLIHVLFVRNHNTICDKLKQSYPDWSTDQLFHTARLINSAMIAKIHTVEWTPAVLPNPKLVGGMGANWWGLLEQMRKPFEERRMTRSLEPKHDVLGGIAGGETNNHDKPYGLSEEFVEVYRLHPGIADWMTIILDAHAGLSERVKIEDTRGTGARKMMEKHGAAKLWESLGNDHMNALENNNLPEFMTEMSVDGNSFVDMGAIDILRARERGVPQYNEFRRMIGLNPIQKFEDLGADAETTKNLYAVYGDVEKMDLLVGTLCEAKRPKMYGFGETLFQVFIQMASRRLQADPFYTEKFTAQYYTKEGMEMIEQCTLKGMLLEQYPELAKTGLANVHNAFEPWSSTFEDKPEEHPLEESERYAQPKKRRTA
jgi:hypothetical protein